MLTLKPAAGHHFNLEAPQKCASHAFVEKTARRLRCQLSETGKQRVQVAVCDDKKTYCHIKRFDLKVLPRRGDKASAVKKGESKKLAYQPQHQRPVLPGFVDNDPQKAQRLARQKQALLLIDFYGIWCPPCNLLDELVYTQKAFQGATVNMVKVSLDADSDLSWRWKDHFRVGGYPTVIIADAELNEIGRMVGYRPLSQVLQWVKEQRALRGEPLYLAQKRLKKPGKQAKKQHARRLRVGRWYYERGEYQTATKFLKGFKGGSHGHYWQLANQLRLNQDSGQSAQLLKTLEQLMQHFSQRVEYSSWLMDLAEHKDKAFYKTVGAKKLLKQARKNLAQWRSPKKRALSEYSLHGLYGVEAMLLEQFGQEAEALETYALAAQHAEDMAKKSSFKAGSWRQFKSGLLSL